MLAACFHAAFSDYLSTLRMEATCSSEMSVDFQRTTWRYVAEDRTLHNHRCHNLKPFIKIRNTVWEIRNLDTASNGENHLPPKLGQVTEYGEAAIAQSV
jgi:hypothetical protein